MGLDTGMVEVRNPKMHLMWYWLPPALWCAIIFIQSCFATPDAFPEFPYSDKIAHIGVYALLSILFCRAFYTIEIWQGRGAIPFVTAVVATVLYGALDEWHQSFVAARSADLLDLLADFAGAMAGAALYWKTVIRKRPL